MEPDQNILGETNQLQQFDGRLENREIARELARQAQRQIRIFTPDLENPIYDNPDFMRSLTVLATHSRQTPIRVLVKDSAQAVKMGHRLIELCRRFTSSIHLHRTPETTEDIDSAYLVADNSGYLYKHVGNLYHGQFNFNDKMKVRELSKHFDEAWERSRPDPEMRRLFI